jgi:hypothetical protein
MSPRGFRRRSPKLAVYEWSAWDGFLIPHAFPKDNLIRIRAHIHDAPDTVGAQLGRDVCAFLFHINLSQTDRFPYERRELVTHLRHLGISVWNDRATDIRKTAIQQTCRLAGLPCASPDPLGDADELLFVKSNFNHGGLVESKLTAELRRQLGTERPNPTIAGPLTYLLLRRREINSEWWTDKTLAIERYISNRSHRFFRAYILGRRLIVSEAYNTQLVQKMDDGIERYNYFITDSECTPSCSDARSRKRIGDIAMQVRRFVASFGLEFGALDVLEDDDGRFYIVDVNSTPYWGSDWQEGFMEFLRASGLGAYT